MDGFTHSLVGLTAAKTGLDRLSPWATTVCVLAANAPDSDVIILLTRGRWSFLEHHRGITHSIIGVLALAVLLPTTVYVAELLIAKLRHRAPTIRYRGLLLASLLATATHPIMDWTNNYGVRPLLPWSGRWFYGDLVFIVDPYILLVVGGAAFMLTSDRRLKIAVWCGLGAILTMVVLLAPAQRGTGGNTLVVARTIWIVCIGCLVIARANSLHRRAGRKLAFAALITVVVYWGGLWLAHRVAERRATQLAGVIASSRSETLTRLATMPTAANPFQWFCVAETDRALYRFFVSTTSQNSRTEGAPGFPGDLERYEKPGGEDARLISLALKDTRAQILMGFARFPMARLADENCVQQTLVQFADLRYTEPGARRGSFSVNVPIDCQSR